MAEDDPIAGWLAKLSTVFQGTAYRKQDVLALLGDVQRRHQEEVLRFTNYCEAHERNAKNAAVVIQRYESLLADAQRRHQEAINELTLKLDEAVQRLPPQEPHDDEETLTRMDTRDSSVVSSPPQLPTGDKST